MNLEQLQKLTPEAKRVAIAEACGWKPWPAPFGCDMAGNKFPGADDPPDYRGDLNAALTLIDFLAKLGWRCNLANGLDCTWECEFMRPPTVATRPEDIAEYHGETLEVRYAPADTLAEAICDGFLLAAVPDPEPEKESAFRG